MLDRLADAAAVKVPDRTIATRRAMFAVVVAVTMVATLWLAYTALADNGLGALNIVILALFALTLPWIVIGFWTAVIGVVLMRSRDPLAAVLPVASHVRGDEPIAASTAILLCIRNEAPERLIRNLEPMMQGIAASGFAERFHLYILSDSGEEAGVAEESRFAALAAAWRGRLSITYRRRTVNAGYKAGNIRDFCDRFGVSHEFALVLDADSFMTPASILRLVRIMQADPKLGILQSLVVGMPSTSAFARLFQFGMRLAMRSYTMGSAWWQSDCGPYWGHNAIWRIAPFVTHCELPVLPGGAHVLSHDQIEAVLMRRAGYDVRVIPEEHESWEENPPTLIEFIRRDQRWCQGNMQYWHFLGLPGLKFVSRYQIAFALLMFIGSPAWMILLVLMTGAVALSNTSVFRSEAGFALFVAIVVMWFAPKTLTMFEALTRADTRRSFGGGVRLVIGALLEAFFSILLVPIMWFGHTVFLAGLLLGRTIGWGGQMRDDHAVPWQLAAQKLWPHTLLGAACLGVLAVTSPDTIPYALFVAGGLALSIPLAVITASPFFGRMLMRAGIGHLPEDTDCPAPLRALALPALTPATPSHRPT